MKLYRFDLDLGPMALVFKLYLDITQMHVCTQKLKYIPLMDQML